MVKEKIVRSFEYLCREEVDKVPGVMEFCAQL